MGETLDKKLSKLDPTRRNEIKKRAESLYAEEMTLRDLRNALELTQRTVSKKLHIKQEGISRLERRSDLLLSTLRDYIQAMGGELKLAAEFPNRPPVLLKGFGDIAHSLNVKHL